MKQRWRAVAPANLLWADCGDSFAVFHRPSGKTHFVNLATALILQEILVQPAGPDDVLVALREATGTAADAGSRDQIVALLQHLEALGLIDRVDP